MRRRRNPPTQVELHISRVVVDGLALSQWHKDDLGAALSAGLSDVLHRRLGAEPILARPARVTEVIRKVDPFPRGDAPAAGRSIGSALAADLLPRLTEGRTAPLGRADR